MICVGNIYIGGTGKTPLAIEICKILLKINKKPAFIKKNYKYVSDEIKLLGKTARSLLIKIDQSLLKIQ